jgi:hypothetical protein
MVLALRPPIYVGFDATTVSAATLARGFGRRRLGAFETVALAEGVLNTSPASSNVLRPGDLREALAQLRSRVGRGGGAVLVLPEGTARVSLLEVEGNDLRDYARFRLASVLPYPVQEAVVDVLKVGPGRALAAAVRRSIVEDYEEAAAGAGFVRERVDLAPLVAVAGLLERDPSPAVHALLGERCLSLAASDRRGLVAFRQRWRDPAAGEGERLFAEAARTARLLGNGSEFRLTLSGAGARAIGRDLAASGLAVEVRGPRDPAPAGEAAWVAGLLA